MKLGRLRFFSTKNASVHTGFRSRTKPISRRGFLKKLSLGAAAIGLARRARVARAQEALTTEEIARRYQKEKQIAGRNWHNLETALKEAKPGTERNALGFLIKNMPERDLENVTSEFVLHHVRKAVEAREKYPWAKKVPDSVFYSYVVPWRAADWQALEQRSQLEELAAKITAGSKNELEACYKIQEWMGNEFQYANPTAGRNPGLSELLRDKKGKCGETSVLFTMMCRSIGIPARYVELPWWSHIYDPAKKIGPDNHAWAEVWTRGVIPDKSLKGGFQPVNTYGTWAPATKEGVLPWAEGAARWGYIPALYAWEFERDETGFHQMRRVNITKNYRTTDSFSIRARCASPPYNVAIRVMIGHGPQKAYGELYRTMSMAPLVDLGDFGGNLGYVVYKTHPDGRQASEPVLVRQLKENVTVNLP